MLDRERARQRDLKEHDDADGGTDDYDRQDREAFDVLPDVITVFRGCRRDRILGLSWQGDI